MDRAEKAKVAKGDVAPPDVSMKRRINSGRMFMPLFVCRCNEVTKVGK
jgi:hypothetical protein